MKSLQSNEQSTPWHRFQRWRAMRMLARIQKLKAKAEALFAKATAMLDRLNGKGQG